MTASPRQPPDSAFTAFQIRLLCGPHGAGFAPYLTRTPTIHEPIQVKQRRNAMTNSTPTTLDKHIRVLPQQWERIERAAQGTNLTANQLVITLAIEALDRREWPRTEAEVRVARASLFTAQAIARDLIAAGREPEVQEIRDFISTIVPDPDAATSAKETTASWNRHSPERSRLSVPLAPPPPRNDLVNPDLASPVDTAVQPTL